MKRPFCLTQHAEQIRIFPRQALRTGTNLGLSSEAPPSSSQMAGLVGGGGEALGDIIKKPLQGMAKQCQLFVFAYIVPYVSNYIV